MKRLFTIVMFLSAALYLSSCGGNRGGADSHSHEATEHLHDHSHDHADHDHSHDAEHSHADHDHAHEAEHTHNHDAEHNHADHNHEAEHTHSHDEAHDHSTHSHADGHSYAGHSHAEEAESHDHSEHEHAAGEIVFTAAQAAMTDFEVQTIARGEFNTTIKCSGVISAPPSRVQILSAPVSGIIHFEQAGLRNNSVVSSGKSLFTISSATLSSGNEAAKAEANFRKAEADLNRLRPLYEEHLISQGEFLVAEQEYNRALAEWEPYRNSNSNGTSISASMNGYITDLVVSEGDYVGVGTPIATVVDGTLKQLRVSVPQRYLSQLPTITNARFTVPTDGATHETAALGGRIVKSSYNIVPGTTMLEMIFEFPGGLFANGSYAEVTLIGTTRHDVITLPLSALTESQGLHYVYVQLDEECYMRREVTIGDDDGLRVEIIAGLEPGERVVTRGAVNVKMASFSGAIPHSHSH